MIQCNERDEYNGGEGLRRKRSGVEMGPIATDVTDLEWKGEVDMSVSRSPSTLARRHVSSIQTPLIKTIVLNLNGRLNIFKIKEPQKSNRVYMLLSKACVYGLRAALFLAVNETDKYTPIRPMSEKL